MSFKKASRKNVKAKLLMTGPAGSGKTYSALLMARGLIGPGGRIGLIDTERQSAEIYSDLTEFFVSPLTPPFTPERYQKNLQDAMSEGFDAIIIDSLSHAWVGAGGILDIHENATKSSDSKNSWQQWNKTSKLNNTLLDSVLAVPVHVIATLRSKTEWVLEQNNKGKMVPVKVGMKPVQREGIDHEFQAEFVLSHNHRARLGKNRIRPFLDAQDDDGEILITEHLGEEFAKWLAEGGDPDAESDAERAWRMGAEACKTLSALRDYSINVQPEDVSRDFRVAIFERMKLALGGQQ